MAATVIKGLSQKETSKRRSQASLTRIKGSRHQQVSLAPQQTVLLLEFGRTALAEMDRMADGSLAGLSA